MIFAQRLLLDVECALAERFGLHVPPLVVVERRQVVKVAGGIRMIFTQRLLLDVEGALVERFGLPVPPLPLIEERQVVEALGGIQMIFAQRLLTNVQRASIKRLCLNVLASVNVYVSYTIDGGRDIAVFSPEESFTNLQHAF